MGLLNHRLSLIKVASRLLNKTIEQAAQNGRYDIVECFVPKNSRRLPPAICAEKLAADDIPQIMPILDKILKAEKWALDTSMTVDEKLAAMIAKIGENMNIRRFEKIVSEDGIVVSYIHAAGKIGVLVEAKTPLPKR